MKQCKCIRGWNKGDGVKRWKEVHEPQSIHPAHCLPGEESNGGLAGMGAAY